MGARAVNARAGMAEQGREFVVESIRCARAVPCFWPVAVAPLLAAALPSAACAQDIRRRPPNPHQPVTTGCHTPAAANARAGADAGTAATPNEGRDRRHRHPPEPPGLDQHQAPRAGMVEAVSAEEIGKLPDVSIAESIARLPGHCGAARRRARGDRLDSRLFARLYDGSAERPPAGELGLQPRGRVRPISVRAARQRRRLQDARRQYRGHGPVRHRRSSDHSAARIHGKRAIARQPARPDGPAAASATTTSRIGAAARHQLHRPDQAGARLDGRPMPISTRRRATDHTKGYNYETFCCGQEQHASRPSARRMRPS